MSETQQRFQFRLRHLLLIVTGLCVLLALAVVFTWLAFLFVFVFVVGSAMARISTRSPLLWIIGPVFALLGGIGVLWLSFFVLSDMVATPLVGFCLFLFGVVFGGWLGGWLEERSI